MKHKGCEKKGSDEQVKKVSIDLTNSLRHYHRKCTENSVENIHIELLVFEGFKPSHYNEQHLPTTKFRRQ